MAEKVEQDALQIAWGILFNEEREKTPDPNRPENLPYITARKRERKESLEKLMSGAGRVLFEQWREQLRSGLVSLLSSEGLDSCHCSTCKALFKLKVIFGLWLEAQRALNDTEKQII